jgi:alanyl-tRNA synthetase
LIQVALDLHPDAHPLLHSGQGVLREYIAEENARFQRTQKRGQRYLDRLLRQRGDGRISGEEMVKLEKQHGVPEPLLEVMLKERQVQFSRDAYQAAYSQWRQAVVGAA